MHGVPLLLAPMGADQPMNTRHAVDAGFALHVGPPARLTPAHLSASLAALLAEPAYAANAARFGEVGRFAGGARRAADLVEHVARVGTSHLSPLGLGAGTLQYYDADLAACFGGLALVAWAALRRCCLRRGRGGRAHRAWHGATAARRPKQA